MIRATASALEINKPRTAVGGKHNIARLEVAVHECRRIMFEHLVTQDSEVSLKHHLGMLHP